MPGAKVSTVRQIQRQIKGLGWSKVSLCGGVISTLEVLRIIATLVRGTP